MQSRFRYVGREKCDGHDCFVVAFVQRPDGAGLPTYPRTGPNGQNVRLQGLAWFEAATKRIVRLRMDMLGLIEGFPLEAVTTNISMVPVRFESIGTVLYLPARVTVHARYAGGELHSVHRYSDYQSETEKSAGIAEVASVGGEDAYELLALGIALAREGKSGEEIAAFREAVRVDPELPAGRFHLANALRNTGDLVGAENELREAVKLVPDSGVYVTCWALCCPNAAICQVPSPSSAQAPGSSLRRRLCTSIWARLWRNREIGPPRSKSTGPLPILRRRMPASKSGTNCSNTPRLRRRRRRLSR